MAHFNSFFLSFYLLLCSSVSGLTFANETLIFSYWSEATPPFIDLNTTEQHKGIIIELGETIGAALQMPVSFVSTPVQRIEEQLKSGTIHIDCITNPIWKTTPEQYNWSTILFTGADRFLVHKNLQHKIKSFSDLQGRTLGIYNGYIYHPDLMEMIESNALNTLIVPDIHTGIKMVQLGRIDALIDFDMLLQHQIKVLKLADTLRLADKYADEYTLHCAYSKKMPVNAQKLNLVIENIIQSGQLKNIFTHYL